MASTNATTTALADRHEDVKYAFAFKNLDWEAYHRYRPVYPASMWRMWFDYHTTHGNGSFATAHDAGSGPGTAATIVGQKFDEVFVSDAGAANLATAEATLTPRDKFTFHHGPAEQTASWLPPASVDFTSICMAFHYMDSAATVRAVAMTLKPGATFAAATYGFRLLFPGQPRAEALWYQATSCESLRLMREGKLFPAAVKGLARAMTGLDFVAFPSDLFENVRRVYVNVKEGEDKALYFVDKDPLWDEAETFVAPTDTREYIQDPTWGRRADAAWLRGFLASSQMGFDETTWSLPEWQELEAIVGSGPDGTIAVEWPVSITLATRKTNA
ncbi:hypothetical protein SEUCBS139899_007575 [Sporothrix eucalyptigena]|uniref:Methyltransferase type 11 domain-containing protein n=1 Tax=Sporothrix eucalyptigena TaxID=1812306 RepID=A0ABP0C2L1_9PEZI